jgi:dTDP-4-amino-4,6-dideoxygalactose transaminase
LRLRFGRALFGDKAIGSMRGIAKWFGLRTAATAENELFFGDVGVAVSVDERDGARYEVRPALANFDRDILHDAQGVRRLYGALRFSEMERLNIPVMKPQLPTVDRLVPYLERVDASRYYSNHGQLVQEFETRLAAHFGLTPTQTMTAANGTTALSAALLAVGASPGKKCLVPSWTFVASAAAIWAANLRPHFVDVSPHTWMLEPEALLQRIDLADVAVVMPVSAFGAPVSTAAWDAFSERTGIPIVIDAAASFDTVASVPHSAPGKSPMMVSFHATKVFGIGEGAAILSTDDELVTRARQICNFGVWGPPAGQVLGYNGKLSEYHAAVGLAALDDWPTRRAAIANLTRVYREELARMQGVETLPGYGEGWVSCYSNVRAHAPVDQIISRLKASGIETRRWWQRGVHEQPAYAAFSTDTLLVTERLGASVFGLPFYHDLSEEEVAQVLEALRSALSLP